MFRISLKWLNVTSDRRSYSWSCFFFLKKNAVSRGKPQELKGRSWLWAPAEYTDWVWDPGLAWAPVFPLHTLLDTGTRVSAGRSHRTSQRPQFEGRSAKQWGRICSKKCPNSLYETPPPVNGWGVWPRVHRSPCHCQDCKTFQVALPCLSCASPLCLL